MLGIIGGLSAESTISYYQMLNALQRERKGPLSSLPLLISSLDFAEIAAAQKREDWQTCASQLVASAQALERAGAGAVLIASNLMHKVADHVSASIGIPLLHIVDAVGKALSSREIHSVCILGTRPTMEESFYRDKLGATYKICSAIPEPKDRDFLQELIYGELCQGRLAPASLARYHDLLGSLLERHQALLLACTELQLGLEGFPKRERCFDSAALHVEYAFEWALQAGICDSAARAAITHAKAEVEK